MLNSLKFCLIVFGLAAISLIGTVPATAQQSCQVTAPNTGTAVLQGDLNCGDNSRAQGGGSAILGATAIGNFANASGSGSTSVGANAGSVVPADGVTSIGANVNSVNTPGAGSIAVGGSTTVFGAARSTGNFSIAIGAETGADPQHQGAFASNTYSIAIGSSSTASGNGGIAIGLLSSASGTGGTAMGPGATANFDNSAAFGQGAATTRINQVAIGTASNTYSLVGVASAESVAAQSGPVSIVTTDAFGNLATMSTAGIATAGQFSALSGQVAALDNRVSSLETGVNHLNSEVRKAFEGTAVAIAMGGSMLPDNKRFAISGNLGTFNGENAFGGAAQLRLSDSFVANGGIGAGFARGGVGGRVGGTFAW
jgi:hypothetical protein